MSHRLRLSALCLSTFAIAAACGGGDDDGAVDARATDAPETDASTIDAPEVDASMIDAPEVDAGADAAQIDAAQIDAGADAGADAMTDAGADAMTDAGADAMTDAGTDAMTPLPGDTCQSGETVTLVNGAATVVATTVGYANNYNSGATCTRFSAAGSDRVHVVTVPAGQRLAATATPTTGTYDLSLYLVATPPATCDSSPLTCLAGSDGALGGMAETAVFHNNTSGAVDVQIIVDGYSSGGDAYTLQVNVGAPLEGESCQVAPATSPGTVTGTIVGYYNNYNPPLSCTGETQNGRDRAYRVNVPAGQTLTATVTPDAGFDPAIYLIGAPASMCDANPITCLDGADLGLDDDPETVTFTNSSGAAVDVYVVVDTFYRFDDMTYSLTVQVQ